MIEKQFILLQWIYYGSLRILLEFICIHLSISTDKTHGYFNFPKSNGINTNIIIIIIKRQCTHKHTHTHIYLCIQYINIKL